MLDPRKVDCTLTKEAYVNGTQASYAGRLAAVSIRRALAIESTADDPRRMHAYSEHVQFVRTGALGSQARGLIQSKKVRRFVRDFDKDREHAWPCRAANAPPVQGARLDAALVSIAVGQLLPSLSACLAALAVALFALPSFGS